MSQSIENLIRVYEQSLADARDEHARAAYESAHKPNDKVMSARVDDLQREIAECEGQLSRLRAAIKGEALAAKRKSAEAEEAKLKGAIKVLTDTAKPLAAVDQKLFDVIHDVIGPLLIEREEIASQRAEAFRTIAFACSKDTDAALRALGADDGGARADSPVSIVLIDLLRAIGFGSKGVRFPQGFFELNPSRADPMSISEATARAVERVHGRVSLLLDGRPAALQARAKREANPDQQAERIARRVKNSAPAAV